MDNQNIESNFELPKPAGDAQGSVEMGAAHEQMTASATTPQPPITGQTVQGAPVPVPLPSSGQQQAQIPAAGTPLKAEDIDLIEKEWVLRAKQIVAQTSGDPFVQNKEINKMKADYIKKRYNKDIKQSND